MESQDGSLVGFPREKESYFASPKFGFNVETAKSGELHQGVTFAPSAPGNSSPRRQGIEHYHSTGNSPTASVPVMTGMRSNSWPNRQPTVEQERSFGQDACLIAGSLVGQAIKIGATSVLSPVVGTCMAYAAGHMLGQAAHHQITENICPSYVPSFQEQTASFLSEDMAGLHTNMSVGVASIASSRAVEALRLAALRIEQLEQDKAFADEQKRLDDRRAERLQAQNNQLTAALYDQNPGPYEAQRSPGLAERRDTPRSANLVVQSPRMSITSSQAKRLTSPTRSILDATIGRIPIVGRLLRTTPVVPEQPAQIHTTLGTQTLVPDVVPSAPPSPSFERAIRESDRLMAPLGPPHYHHHMSQVRTQDYIGPDRVPIKRIMSPRPIGPPPSNYPTHEGPLRSNRVVQIHPRKVAPQHPIKSIHKEVAPQTHHVPITNEMTPQSVPRAIIRDAAPQSIKPPVPKAESEEDYTPIRVSRASSHLNEENLKLLDHVHGSGTWEGHSNKEAVKMHTWLQTSVLAAPPASTSPPPKKGREYVLCPTKATKSIPAPIRRSKPPPSESSFSSSAVTSKQDEAERMQAFQSCTIPSKHHHHHHRVPQVVRTPPHSEKPSSSRPSESFKASTAPRKVVVPEPSSHRSRISKKPSTQVQDKPAADNMTNMVTALMQMAQAITDGKAGTNTAHQSTKPPSDKFKIMFNLQLKKISLSKGERVTAPYVIGVFNAARDIDTAALKASNRQPVTQDEWNSFFKFHLGHMTGALYEELVVLVHQGKFKDSKLFWNAVYQKLFPAYPAREALNKALASYMVWDEPLGIERWEAITKSMVEYQGSMSGKVGEDQVFHMAESFHQQIQRVIDTSVDACSAMLCREFSTFTAQIEETIEAEEKVTGEMYQKANKGFMRYLIKWLNKYTYTLTFGHPQAVVKKVPNPAVQGQTNLNHIHTPATDSTPTTPRESVPPTYQQVVTEGGQGPPQTPNKHVPAANKVLRYDNQKPPPLDKIAPTGKHRTWHMRLRTNPTGGPRIPCSDPPPPECTDTRCQYYGDWLDIQGLCTYCLSADHQKADCPKHKAATEAYYAKFPRQENYRAPAQ